MPCPQKAVYRGSAKRKARLPRQSASDGSLLAVNILCRWALPLVQTLLINTTKPEP